MYGLDSNSLSLLGFAAVVIVGAIAMYLVSLISMKETSFESVLEEQRKKEEKEDKERSIQNKQKREQYKKKFDQKKKKMGNGKVEKMDSGVSPMHEVQIKETPQVLNDVPAPVPEQKTVPEQKKTKAKPAKKQESPAQPKQTSSKSSQPIVKSSAPEKAKVEVAQPVHSTQTTPIVAKVEAPKNKPETNRTRTVSFSDEAQEKQKPESDQEKTKKKKKKTEIEVESAIVTQLKESTLSDRDVQNVLTLIKQKHGIDVGGGSKIKDLQQQLDGHKKKLTQSEAGLEQYVTRCMAAEKKIDQLKQDLMLEKTKVESLEKAMHDADNKSQKELGMAKNHHLAELKQLQGKIEMAADYEKVCQLSEKLKTENSLLLNEVQKNAPAVADKDRLSKEIKQMKQKLQDSQRRCTEFEAKIGEYSQHSENMEQQQVETEKKYRLQLNEQTLSLQQTQQKFAALDGEYQKVKVELQTTQSNSTKLLEQVTSLTEDNDSKTDAQRNLEQRLLESGQQVADKELLIENMTKQNTELAAQVQNLEQRITQLNSEIVKVEQETKVKAAGDAKSDKDIEEMETAKNENIKLKEDVDGLKKKNNELRERNWKAMDAVSQLEKTMGQKITTAKADGDVRCARLEQSVKQSLSDVFPDIKTDEEEFEAWVKAFVNAASKEIVQSTDSSSEIDEAKQEVQKLNTQLQKSSDEASRLQAKIEELESSISTTENEKESLEEKCNEKKDELTDAQKECNRYKNILNSTEEILSKLQSSVEVEEGVWKKKVQEAHQKTSEAHQDAKDLQTTIEELKAENSSKTSNLKNSEELKRNLEEMTNKVSELEEKLALSAPKITDNGNDDDSLVQSTALSNGFEDELAKLKERLEKEKRLSKDLGQAATKLQTVLKQTQEQLNDEREKNVELEQKSVSENNVKK